MPASRFAALLPLIVLSEGASAQPRPVASSLGVRRVAVSAEASEARTPEVWMSPGVSTTFEFDTDLAQKDVVVEGAERFSLVDLGRSTLRVVPSERIVPGERLRLTVRFRDGAAPAGAAFVLVAHPAQAERLVEVSRQPRTLESYQQEVREAREEVQRYREENTRLRTEHGSPGGLTGLLANDSIRQQGVAAKRLDVNPVVSRHRGGAVEVRWMWSYRSAARVALDMTLNPPDAAQSWTVDGAALESKTGESLRVFPVWQALINNGVALRVVVEAEATPDAAQGAFILKLWDADGLRSITIPGVTFP
ncbi:DUF2381 family protein [Myxococcaceae bacterium GXIMD 01537]